jgi:hypothetical protein
MDNKPYAIIDIDLTLVDSVTGPYGWLDWLNSMTGRNHTAEELGYDYNLGKFYKEDLAKLKVDPMDWWRYPGIYDCMKPLEYAHVALSRLKFLGYEIVFVSHVKGQHSKSKHNFLKRHFSDLDYSYLVTKEKHRVNSGTGKDIFVDDRHDYINKSNARHVFLFNTPWTQFEELKRPYTRAFNWKDILEYFD